MHSRGSEVFGGSRFLVPFAAPPKTRRCFLSIAQSQYTTYVYHAVNASRQNRFVSSRPPASRPPWSCSLLAPVNTRPHEPDSSTPHRNNNNNISFNDKIFRNYRRISHVHDSFSGQRVNGEKIMIFRVTKFTTSVSRFKTELEFRFHGTWSFWHEAVFFFFRFNFFSHRVSTQQRSVFCTVWMYIIAVAIFVCTT